MQAQTLFSKCACGRLRPHIFSSAQPAERGRVQDKDKSCQRVSRAKIIFRHFSTAFTWHKVCSPFLEGSDVRLVRKQESRGTKRDKLNGTNRAEFAVFRRISLTFADFRFSWEVQHFGGADFRRKPQETADFRRNPFVPFSLSLLIPP